MLGSSNLWGDAVKILQSLYSDLPSDKEIRLAKSNSLTLASYQQETKKTTTKKTTPKKKTAKYKKGTKKVSSK
jgi:hypothetical protein